MIPLQFVAVVVAAATGGTAAVVGSPLRLQELEPPDAAALRLVSSRARGKITTECTDAHVPAEKGPCCCTAEQRADAAQNDWVELKGDETFV